MQEVLCKDLWARVRKAFRHASSRQCAIAYTTSDLIGLKSGDVLISDASVGAIRAGHTSAALLLQLARCGVEVRSCPGLHAKVGIADGVAYIGSGNLSASSKDGLIEVGVLTDHTLTVSAVAAVIESLRQVSKALSERQLLRLCGIVVERSGSPPRAPGLARSRMPSLGHQTWLLGVHEIVREPKPVEQRLVTLGTQHAAAKAGTGLDGISWVRFPRNSGFSKNVRPGDAFMCIWRPAGAATPKLVYPAAAIIHVQRAEKWVRAYYVSAEDGEPMTWASFRRVLKKVGYSRHVGPSIARVLGVCGKSSQTRIDSGWRSY